MSENHGNHQHGHTKHHFTKYSQYVGIYSPKKVDIPSPKSKKDKLKTEEGESQDYQFDNTSSLWNQLRTAWKEYHSIKKIQKPQISKNQKTSSDKQLLGIETLIVNLLSTLKLPINSDINLFDMTVENVDGLEFNYGKKGGKKIVSKHTNVIILFSVIILFFVIIAITSILSLENESYYFEYNWFVYVGIGVFAFSFLLLNTTTYEKPRDFARLHVYEFLVLSVLVVSLVLSVVLFPVEIFPENMAVKKIAFESDVKPNGTQWLIAIGDVTTKGESIGLQVPIYLIVAGISGAYLRYIYGYIRGETKTDENSIIKLKELYFNHKKIINTICIATGLDYSKIREGEKTDFLKLKHMHKVFENNRKVIYSLPPHTTAELATYLADVFNHLYNVQQELETLAFQLRISTYKRTIKTIGAFFLAPLLAIIAWLLLALSASEAVNWQAFAVLGFGAGLSTDAIIERIWTFMGERLPSKSDDQQTPISDELTKLAKLKEEGKISEEEFSKMKQKLINNK